MMTRRYSGDRLSNRVKQTQTSNEIAVLPVSGDMAMVEGMFDNEEGKTIHGRIKLCIVVT